MAEAAGADLRLSIHHNAGEGHGAEMYYARENLNAERSRTLATLLQHEFVDVLGRRNREAQFEVFYVTRFASMPAVLSEGAFLTDPDEAWLLADPDYRQQMAESMAAVLERYFADRPAWLRRISTAPFPPWSSLAIPHDRLRFLTTPCRVLPPKKTPSPTTANQIAK
jgi:hypothetical protein